MPRLWHDGNPVMTCDHACHRRRGSLGGEDFAVREGTPLKAPVAGTYRFHTNGTGGWTMTVIPADARLRGFVIQALHLSGAAHLALNAGQRYYDEGQIVAYSGGRVGHPGAGQSTGPHTHEHGIIAGVRTGIRDAIARARALLAPIIIPATPSNPTPITDSDTENEEWYDMSKPIQIHHTEGGGVTRAIWVPGTSYFLPWTAGDPTIANAFSAAGMGASVLVTESLYNAIARECDDMKRREISGSVTNVAPAADPELLARIAGIEKTLAGIAAAIEGGAS